VEESDRGFKVQGLSQYFTGGTVENGETTVRAIGLWAEI
jgi:hypothetical protein